MRSARLSPRSRCLGGSNGHRDDRSNKVSWSQYYKLQLSSLIILHQTILQIPKRCVSQLKKRFAWLKQIMSKLFQEKKHQNGGIEPRNIFPTVAGSKAFVHLVYLYEYIFILLQTAEV